MPKTFYTNEAEIPENLKGAYELKNGRYELTALEDDHPVLSTNKSLTNEQARLKREREAAQAERDNLKAEIEELKTKPHVPAGQRLVPKEIAELGEAAKQAGITKDEAPQLKTKLIDYERKEQQATRDTARAKAAAASGFNADKFNKLAAREDFEVESEKATENGKEIEKFYAVTKDAAGNPVKTAFAEFVEQHDVFGAVLDSLKETGEQRKAHTPFPRRETPATGNLYDKIREEAKPAEGATPVKATLNQRFGLAG
jgi:chromosome segregation ATPase